nr:hypothetical protein [Tanacetum cinerariifolium]
MKIPDWMILEEMKQIEHYRMYAEVFGTDVPLIQSSPTESTQGTHRTPSAPRSPTYKVDAAESSVPKRSTMIRLRLPQQKYTRLTTLALVLTVDKADELILQDTLQVLLSIKVDKSMKLEKMWHWLKSTWHLRRLKRWWKDKSMLLMIVQSLGMMNIIFSALGPSSCQGSHLLLFLIIFTKQWLTHYLLWSTSILKSKFNSKFLGRFEIKFQYIAEGLIIERQKNKEEMEKMIAKAILQERGNIQAYISSQIQQVIANDIPSQADASVRSYLLGHILHVHQAQPQITSVPEQQYQLYLLMKDDPQWQQQDIAIWLAPQMKFERLQVPQTTCRTPAVRLRDRDNPHDDAHPEGENSAKQ